VSRLWSPVAFGTQAASLRATEVGASTALRCFVHLQGSNANIAIADSG
jgi:hypothetical protein